MATRKVLAREFTVEVQAADTDWLPIGGLQTIGFDSGKTDAPTTDFDSGGWAEHMVAERTRSVTLDGLWMEDPSTGDTDPGQARLEVLGDLVGSSSLGAFRLTHVGGTVWAFSASVQFGGPSGGHNDPTKFTCALAVSGETTKTAGS